MADNPRRVGRKGCICVAVCGGSGNMESLISANGGSHDCGCFGVKWFCEPFFILVFPRLGVIVITVGVFIMIVSITVVIRVGIMVMI